MSNATTINGVSAYATSTSGTVTNYIPAGFLSAAELAFIDTQAGLASGASRTLQVQLTSDAGNWTNGQNAWTHFQGYVLSYDTANNEVVLAGADIAGAAGANPTQAEYATAVAMVNALKHIISANIKQLAK